MILPWIELTVTNRFLSFRRLKLGMMIKEQRHDPVALPEGVVFVPASSLFGLTINQHILGFKILRYSKRAPFSS